MQVFHIRYDAGHATCIRHVPKINPKKCFRLPFILGADSG